VEAGMAKWFRKSIEAGGHVTTVWSFIPAALQTSVTAGLSGVTAYFGYQELGIARAVFLATGVMAFGLTVTFLWLRISQILGIYQRLSVGALGVPNVALDSSQKPTKVSGINIQCVLRNDSQVLMFYQLKRVRNVMESRVPATHTVDHNIVTIPPNGGTQVINFATIEDIPFPDKKELRTSGNVELEVAYGRAKDELDFLFRYTSDLQVVFSKLPGSKNYRVDAVSSVTGFEHSKLS
jgi:hypothetical protein